MPSNIKLQNHTTLQLSAIQKKKHGNWFKINENTSRKAMSEIQKKISHHSNCEIEKRGDI